jgi:polysaccharide export outer membrane protein
MKAKFLRMTLLSVAGTVLAGCAFPGYSLRGGLESPGTTGGASALHGYWWERSSRPKEASAVAVSRYTVQPITPALIAHLTEMARKQARPQPNPSLKQAIADYAYHVAPHDVLEVTVWGHPEFSAASAACPAVAVPSPLTATAMPSAGEACFTVGSDGTLYFPYVGLVHVAGLTVEEIRSRLARRLVAFVRDPQVSVTDIGFHSQTYQLAGAVTRPGLYPLTNVPMTVSQAIQAAGGVLHPMNGDSSRGLADLAHVLYIDNGRREVLDLRAFFQDGDESQDRVLQAGDIIDVPDDSFDQVHLIGEIKKPGNYPLSGGRLNLAQALDDAGGLDLTTANAGRIFVFRGAYAKAQIFWLDARSPVAMLLADEFELQPQDVVFVAAPSIVSWNRIIAQILPTVESAYETKVLVAP